MEYLYLRPKVCRLRERREYSVKNKSFTRNFVPMAKSLQTMKKGLVNKMKNIFKKNQIIITALAIMIIIAGYLSFTNDDKLDDSGT